MDSDFIFYCHETTEPPHIHIDKDGSSAKFWLEDISLARNIGFSAKELSKIRYIILENQKMFLEKWNGYFK